MLSELILLKFYICDLLAPVYQQKNYVVGQNVHCS